MTTYTTAIGKRDPIKLQVTKDEAAAMLQKGFRFAEFSVEGDRYRISMPFTVIKNLERGLITFEQ